MLMTAPPACKQWMELLPLQSQISGETILGQCNPFLTLVYIPTNACKSLNPNGANRGLSVAGLSACVSMLLHICRDRARQRKGRERDSLSHARLHGSGLPGC